MFGSRTEVVWYRLNCLPFMYWHLMDKFKDMCRGSSLHFMNILSSASVFIHFVAFSEDSFLYNLTVFISSYFNLHFYLLRRQWLQLHYFPSQDEYILQVEHHLEYQLLESCLRLEKTRQVLQHSRYSLQCLFWLSLGQKASIQTNPQ